MIATSLAACGGASTVEPKPATTAPPLATADDAAARARAEQAQHDANITAHRKLESEQQDALAATCTTPATPQPRCLPSCYTTEPADPRAGKHLAGPIAIEHLVCEQAGTYVLADELDPKLTAAAVHGRFPKPHKAGTWQATIETALAPAPKSEMIVTGTWRSITHPLTKQKLRCVVVANYRPAMKKPLDACASDGSIGCEAIGDAAAHGINVVHYRLLEARRLQTAGKLEDCQRAALETIAVARGMPRWRQYAKLNVDQFAERAKYRTRFDGLLDEDTLFETAISLGEEAKQVYISCGGTPDAPTAVADEQSFHMCW
jgi:hypothetical protein